MAALRCGQRVSLRDPELGARVEGRVVEAGVLYVLVDLGDRLEWVEPGRLALVPESLARAS